MSSADTDSETFAEWQISVTRRIRDVLFEYDCTCFISADRVPHEVMMLCLAAYIEEQDLFTFLTDAIAHREKDFRQLLSAIIRADRSPHEFTGDVARQGTMLIEPMVNEALNPFYGTSSFHKARAAEQSRRVADLKAETQ